VRRSLNSSGDQSNSTYRWSQFSVTFIRFSVLSVQRVPETFTFPGGVSNE
jgi:hypothetical protein